MPEGHASVPAHSPWRNFLGSERLFEQLVRSCTWLALHQTDPSMCEIFHASNSERIASTDDDSLFPGRKVDEQHSAAG
jgi:hypothetical protein